MGPIVQIESLGGDPLEYQTAWLCEGFTDDESAKLIQAFKIADALSEEKPARPKGIEVAGILSKLDADAQTLQASLLSDPRLRESLDESFVSRNFGEAVAKLVENVNWLNTFNEYSSESISQPEQAESLRRMLLAMVDDVRAVVIKLAYRLQRLRILPQQGYEVRLYIAQETLDIYVPLANRLGVGQLKWELEDLAFRYLNPQRYKNLATLLAENRAGREQYIGDFIAELREILLGEGLDARIYGRPKHLYSIWRKMQEKQIEFSELYDLRAVRVIVDKMATCYSVLGLVHGHWQYIPAEFDDYIANPKKNGYQSLHTVVIGPNASLVEIQIRTRAMHQYAEMGVAAHWRYKEGGRQDAAVEKSIASLRQLLDSRENDWDLVDDLRSEIYADRIFVLTPRGDIKDLVKGATPLDFAYSIHTEVGHRCRGAKINGRIVPLTYTLKSGEKVEILTTKNGGPSRSWVSSNEGYLKSSNAISKVRAWFKHQDHAKNIHDGKVILETERQRLGVKEVSLDDLLKHFHLAREEDLLIQIGRGEISPALLGGALKIPDLPNEVLPKVSHRREKAFENSDVIVLGVGNLLTTFGRCCTPVPGDSIIGYITVGKGVTIHRQDCANILRVSNEKQSRLVDVTWGEKTESFPIDVVVKAIDRQGLLRDITGILANQRVNIVSVNTRTHLGDLSVSLDLTIEICNSAQLSQLLDKISQLHNVLECRRKA